MGWLEGGVERSFRIPIQGLSERVEGAFIKAMETICAVAEELERDGALGAPVARRAADRRPMRAEELRAYVRAKLDEGADALLLAEVEEVELHRDVGRLAAERHTEGRPEPAPGENDGARDSVARHFRRLRHEIVDGFDWHVVASGATPFPVFAARSRPRPRRVSAARAVAEISDALLDELQAGAFANKRALYDEAHRRIERRYGSGACSRASVQSHVRNIAKQRLGHDWARFLTGGRKRS